MNARFIRSILAGLLFLFMSGGDCLAYVQPLHRKMSARAYDLAVGESDFLARYNWTAVSNTLRLELENGAHDEDLGLRSLHHFYSPYGTYAQDAILLPELRGALTEPVPVGGMPTCMTFGKPAPNWALDWDRYYHLGTGANYFSLRDAHGALWQALTGRTAPQRYTALRQVFKALGHQIHLLQDMAQPDHTRNDQHLNLAGLQATLTDKGAALYEDWSGNTLLNHSTLPDGSPVEILFSNAVRPRPNISLRNLFSDMADYSSTNFLTQDTNYGDVPLCATFAYPDKATAIKRTQSITLNVYSPSTKVWQSKVFPEVVYSWALRSSGGTWGDGDVDQFHSFQSIFDYEAANPTNDGVQYFSLNPQSWGSRAKRLIPRAIGYSAEYLKLFFQNKLGATLTPVDDAHLNLKLTYRGARGNGNLGGPLELLVLRKNAGEELTQIYPTTEQAAPQSMASLPTLNIPYTINGEPFFRREIRVAVRGKDLLLDDQARGAVAVAILPPRNEMQVELTYDSAYAYGYQGVRMDITGEGWDEFGQRPVDGIADMNSSTNGPFTKLSQPPRNGSFKAWFGLADDQATAIILNIYPRLPNPRPPNFVGPGSVTVKIYRNGGQIFSFVFIPAPDYYEVVKTIRVTGTGSVTFVPPS